MKIRLADLIRALRARRPTAIRARCRRLACGRRYQRSYFAPALFSLVPVETDLIGSMAVDAHWRLYYNDAWLARAHASKRTRRC